MTTKLPKCPMCNTNSHVKPSGVSGEEFDCGKCGGHFDSDPSEGGDFSDFNPAARLEREDRRREQQRQRRR